MTIVVRLHRQR